MNPSEFGTITNPPTCRRCNSKDHQASDCRKRRCFNCGDFDHAQASCPETPQCPICESSSHLADSCAEWQIWQDVPGTEDYETDSSEEQRMENVVQEMIEDTYTEETSPENPSSPSPAAQQEVKESVPGPSSSQAKPLASGLSSSEAHPQTQPIDINH